jgi:hypothetical protein
VGLFGLATESISLPDRRRIPTAAAVKKFSVRARHVVPLFASRQKFSSARSIQSVFYSAP